MLEENQEVDDAISAEKARELSKLVTKAVSTTFQDGNFNVVEVTTPGVFERRTEGERVATYLKEQEILRNKVRAITGNTLDGYSQYEYLQKNPLVIIDRGNGISVWSHTGQDSSARTFDLVLRFECAGENDSEVDAAKGQLIKEIRSDPRMLESISVRIFSNRGDPKETYFSQVKDSPYKKITSPFLNVDKIKPEQVLLL